MTSRTIIITIVPPTGDETRSEVRVNYGEDGAHPTYADLELAAATLLAMVAGGLGNDVWRQHGMLSAVLSNVMKILLSEEEASEAES